MQSLVPGLLIGAVAVSILTAGACGGSTDSNGTTAGDASTDAPLRYETAPPDDDAGPTYTPQTTRCVAGAYTNPVTDPDGGVNFITDDAGDDDAGTSFGLPQLVSIGGPIIKTPRILPITYLGDDLADEIEDFVGSVGCTSYWQSVVSEYGIGQAQMLTPVRLPTAAPASMSDLQISSYLAKQIAAKAPGFTDPPDDVIYAFFFPTGTTVELQGEQSCTSFGGYHNAAALSGATAAYAVIPRCAGDDFTSVSSAASHEFIEASTDPNPESDAAYLLPDSNHIAFSMLGGGEAGDLCEFSRTADFTPTGYPFTVQRTWSNASILAGHDPCVPAQPGPFLSAIPDQPDTISVINTGSGPTTRGVAIPVGGTRTIDVHFHSDDPTVTSWTIAAQDASRFSGGSSHLTLTLDTTTATIGQVAHLTITRNSQGTVYGAEPFTIKSTSSAKTSSNWVGVVGMP
jgi:hypothetical protein